MPDTPFVRTCLADLAALLETELPRARGAGLIVGPSHAVRWRHAIVNGVLPGPYEIPKIIGEGGFPVWNRSIFGQIFNQHATGQQIFLILPDYRFGNSLYDAPGGAMGRFENHHTHISKELIRPEVDAVMYRQQVENLAVWRAIFGPDLVIFDWTQLMTASEHRWIGRYVDDRGNYRNPPYAQWIASDRARLGALSWPERLLVKENARLRRLIVDRSLHPSATGFFLLHYMVHRDPFMVALQKAETLWHRWLETLSAHLARGPGPEDGSTEGAGAGGRPVAVTGSSVWFATALRQLGADGCAQLRRAGMFLPGPEDDPRLPPSDLPEDALHVAITDAVDLRDYGDGSRTRPHQFQWAVFARNVVSARHKTNAHLAVPGIEVLSRADRDAPPGRRWIARMLAHDRPEMLVDAGGDLSPSMVGLAHVLLSLREALADADTATTGAAATGTAATGRDDRLPSAVGGD